MPWLFSCLETVKLYIVFSYFCFIFENLWASWLLCFISYLINILRLDVDSLHFFWTLRFCWMLHYKGSYKGFKWWSGINKQLAKRNTDETKNKIAHIKLVERKLERISTNSFPLCSRLGISFEFFKHYKNATNEKRTYFGVMLLWGAIFKKICILESLKFFDMRTLTHFSPVSHFYTPWKGQSFLAFSGGIEMWHWTKMG